MPNKSRVIVAFALAIALLLVVGAAPAMAKGKGFDSFGYNYKARIFSGHADGVDRVIDGAVWGDPTYANDHLVMKWSKAWDDARFHSKPWTAGAWCTNHWNGNVPGGSGESEFCKIIWVGSTLESSPLWRQGGYAIWGEFEVIFDRYKHADGTHEWVAKTIPAGLPRK